MEFYNKFLVINRKYIENLSEDDQNTLGYLIELMGQPKHFYYVVNSDEPYAEIVKELIANWEEQKDLSSGVDVECPKCQHYLEGGKCRISDPIFDCKDLPYNTCQMKKLFSVCLAQQKELALWRGKVQLENGNCFSNGGYCMPEDCSEALCFNKEMYNRDKKIEELEEYIQVLQPTGICDVCQTKLHEQNEELKGKLQVATEALNFITGTCPDNECKKHKYIITRIYQDCYHCLVEKAQQALNQIESEER